MRPRQGLEHGEFFSFGVGKAWLWAEPAQDRMPGRQGWERFLPRRFPFLAPAGWGCSPGSPHPCSHPVRAHARLALAPCCPHACLPSLLLPARAPSAVTVSPRACPAGWLRCWLWAKRGVLLPSLWLQRHLCHQVMGLAPEPCQTLQLCLCPPGIQGLVLMPCYTLIQG